MTESLGTSAETPTEHDCARVRVHEKPGKCLSLNKTQLYTCTAMTGKNSLRLVTGFRNLDFGVFLPTT